MKNIISLTYFPVIRALERMLSVSSLYFLLRWVTWPRAFFNTAFRKPGRDPALPGFLTIHKTRAVARRQRERSYLQLILKYFPDRLALPKWRKLCQIDGLEPVQAALAEGRPVILATVHFGVYAQTRLWLRAHGLPAATLAGGQARQRSATALLSDAYSPALEIPVCFHQDQLRALKQHLTDGHPLIITFDGPAGKRITTPFCDGWNMEIATGTLRLAARQQAEIFPFTAVDLGQWRTKIKIGRPVPAKYLGETTDFQAAVQHLIAELLPTLRQHPDQIKSDLALRFKPAAGPSQVPVANSNDSGSLTAAT